MRRTDESTPRPTAEPARDEERGAVAEAIKNVVDTFRTDRVGRNLGAGGAGAVPGPPDAEEPPGGRDRT